MQLDTAPDTAEAAEPAQPASSPLALRERLSTAALALLLVPAAAGAETAANQVDFTTLFYGEQNRTQVFEPIVRATRLFGDGQSLSAQLGLDVITGSSPSGALPSGSVQTMTTPSGRLITVPAGQIPLTKFEDHRAGLDIDWRKPWGSAFTTTLGGHASREKDYQSLGVNAKVSVDLDQHLFTVTAGGAFNDDSVFPVGGTPAGLSDGSEVTKGSNSKRVKSALFGISHVLTRRWIVSVDGTRTYENGYLTEPYKVISVVSPFNGLPVFTLTDNRPSSRARSSALLSSVYHLANDILYTSYRYYTDTWDIRSNTFDLKYRHDLNEGWYFEPHVRYYRQTAASFYTIGLSTILRPPEYATADYRLGRLTTLTLGANLGFRLGDSPSQWTLRAEYIRQKGDTAGGDQNGVRSHFDLTPTINTFTAVLGYSFNF
ncbi:MAG TPA: DUF3570 domain-containing protein [Thermoanaerobaculia bacterium]